MLNMYYIFFKIGALCFGGGYVILPLIEEYLITQNYISYKTLLDVITISQMTPGPIAINSATFIGMKNYGYLGMIVASIGVISPQLIILNIFIKFIGFKNKILKRIIVGLKPATVALIIVASINIFKISIFSKSNINKIGIICFLMVIFLEIFKIKNIHKLLICVFLSFFIKIIFYFIGK